MLGAEGDASASVEHHLEMGKKLLAAGQLTEALSHYHSAIGMKNAFLYFNNINEIFIFLNLNYDNTFIFCTLRLNCCIILKGYPSNYMTYFKRAAVLLALGRSKSALPDLDKTIELRPDFLSVHISLIYFSCFINLK